MASPSVLYQFTTDTSDVGPLLAALRRRTPGHSWSQLRRWITGRHVTVQHAMCLDESRKLRAGQPVCVLSRPLPPPPHDEDVKILFCDRHLVIVEKPARMVTLRHRAERHWPAWRKLRQPTLDEAVARRITHPKRLRSHGLSPVFDVHRIDRDTSGLLVFARTAEVQAQLIEQFARREVVRLYRTIIPGRMAQQTIRSRLVRDRGDGLRGSTDRDDLGYVAVTHLRPLAGCGDDHSELECRLETGRTHQIRIHLAEAEHPVCGDPIYRGPFGQPPIDDVSGAPRLALHAAQLGLIHPVTGHDLHYETPWPTDMQRFRQRLTDRRGHHHAQQEPHRS